MGFKASQDNYENFLREILGVDSSHRGKRVDNPDGSFSTERTRTFEMDGKYYNIPTLINGEQKSPDEAFQLFRDGKIKAVGVADTEDQAIRMAKERSLMLGKEKTKQQDSKILNFFREIFQRGPDNKSEKDNMRHIWDTYHQKPRFMQKLLELSDPNFVPPPEYKPGDEYLLDQRIREMFQEKNK